VFGVPTCRFDDELYSGEDTFDDMVLEAGGPQRDERLERRLSLGTTAERRR
jgi:hypothetical protein